MAFLPETGGQSVWCAASVRRGRASETSATHLGAPSLSLASPLSAGSTQVALQSAHPGAQLTALLPPWGQRLGCRADSGQASLVGVGLREEAITPASHSFVPHPPSPQRGLGRACEQQTALWAGGGQDRWGMLRKGPGVWVGAATS